MLKFLIVAPFLVIFILFFGFFFSSEDRESSVGERVLKQDESMNVASEDPLPFEELTIPFLKSRSYTSNLGELVLSSQSGTYSSYLTSYSSDNLKVEGLLTVPVGEKPEGGFPAIIFVHGYIPPTQYQTLTKYQDYVDYLARNGFVVFKIDLRGHGNSEGDASGAYYSSDYVVDVLSARVALQNSDFVNPTRIGLWGHSMAGNVIFRAAAAAPDVKAVVIWAGAVYSYEDLQKYGLDDNSYRPPANDTERQRKRQELFDRYGQFNPRSDFWTKVVATNYISEFEGAIQLHHAVDDTVVNIGYSRDLKSVLDNTLVKHELFEYPSGGHNMTGSAFGVAMGRTVSFFRENL